MTERGKKPVKVKFQTKDYEWLLDLMIKVHYVVDVNPARFSKPVLNHIAGIEESLGEAAEQLKTPQPIVSAGKKSPQPLQKPTKRQKTTEQILSFRRPFTVVQAANRSHTSLGTARGIIEDLEKQKLLKEAGTDPKHAGRGRAPMRYKPYVKDRK